MHIPSKRNWPYMHATNIMLRPYRGPIWLDVHPEIFRLHRPNVCRSMTNFRPANTPEGHCLDRFYVADQP